MNKAYRPEVLNLLELDADSSGDQRIIERLEPLFSVDVRGVEEWANLRVVDAPGIGHPARHVRAISETSMLAVEDGYENSCTNKLELSMWSCN